VIRINLLPHREEKRRARSRQFYALVGLVVVLGAAIWLLGFTVLNGYLNSQQATNDFLKGQIASLDKEIDEIKKLKEQTEALLARKQVIESLQANRAETVHLFNELARQMPTGIYLKSVKQSARMITLNGYSQSSARVSTLMRNLDETQLLEKPDLVEIKAATVDKRRVSEFTLNVKLEERTGETGTASGKNAESTKGGKP
jgi:type IV pilus assembly protein PilN